MASDDKTGLEAALAENWDRETLAVYADHLQAIGDPRGELIVLDLELATRTGRESTELALRRASLLSNWLGRLAPSDPHTPWIGDSFRFGFVEDLVLDDRDPNAADSLRAMLQSPLAPYVKRVTIRGEPDHVAGMLRQLAQLTHAWLAELAVTCWGAVDPNAASAFITAAPRLALLEVAGDDVFAAFPHPHLARLRVSGGNALPAIFDGGLATVHTLDLALQAPSEPDRWRAPYTGKPAAIRLPALRVLDLSRCFAAAEPFLPDAYDDDTAYGDDDGYGETPGALALLASQPIRTQLTHLTLPALPSLADFEQLDALVTNMRALEQVTIARSHYFHPPPLTNPRVTLVHPPPWPWPPPAELAGGDGLYIQCPGSHAGDVLPIIDAARVMEARFETLEPSAREAWSRFWVLVTELGAVLDESRAARTEDRTFPARLLDSALDACAVGGSGGWRELRDELRFRRPLAPDAVITVHRVRSVVP